MVFKRSALSRLFLIRATFPLIILAVLVSNQGPHFWLLGFFILSLLDFIGGIIQLIWKPGLIDYKFAAVRDVIYAAAFYLLVLQNIHIPAMMLAPSALAEVFVLFGYRVFLRAFIAEALMLVVRMSTVYYKYHFIHPNWAIMICTASLVMGLLGLEIKRMEELQREIVLQQRDLKATLAEMVTATLSSSGIDKAFIQQKKINPMLEEICEQASLAKGREIGQHLADAIAERQAIADLFTSRELEVLEMAVEEQSYRQIAEQLQVSPGTVRAHVASIMRKAGVHTKDDLVHWAHDHRLLSVEKSV
ncbi:helix-turn-helix transcriptional regulator [Alicyclobacillus sp. SO9]|uniref:helix-turn-helix transcriptional regulator n=1 Tax=Alicyclobacillus sp. SO9 TaxID=2665646 RepID=UPI0018E7F92B|nr:helix-turn-helix transcriptional regulator [Alicyclobacillus sp. SO9]QQE79251.1 hypothetical protein GI364_01690 [Alicyclobacillus sp. SO9]